MRALPRGHRRGPGGTRRRMRRRMDRLAASLVRRRPPGGRGKWTCSQPADPAPAVPARAHRSSKLEDLSAEPTPCRGSTLRRPLRAGKDRPVTAKNRSYRGPPLHRSRATAIAAAWARSGVKAEGGWGVVCTEYCSILSVLRRRRTAICRPSLWDDIRHARSNALMTDQVHRTASRTSITCGTPYNSNLFLREIALDDGQQTVMSPSAHPLAPPPRGPWTFASIRTPSGDGTLRRPPSGQAFGPSTSSDPYATSRWLLAVGILSAIGANLFGATSERSLSFVPGSELVREVTPRNTIGPLVATVACPWPSIGSAADEVARSKDKGVFAERTK